ncbi:MAG: MFS transporter [Candidatus Nanopelagicales bacterium]
MRVPARPVSDPARSTWSFPDFRRLFIARGLSSAGSYMQIVAATWFAYKITGSAASVGLLSALALGPAIVGGPIGGALADRFDSRRLALVLYVFQGIPAAVMAIMDLTGELRIGWLYVLVFAGAIPYSLNCPVIALVSVDTVPEEYRQTALSQSQMMFNLTRLGGAVIGGFAVHWLGVGTAFALNAASYFLVAVVLVRTTLITAVPPIQPSGSPQENDEDSRDTVNDSAALSLTRLAAVGVGVFFTFVAPVEQLMPTVAQEHGMTASAVGLLLGAIGLGAVLANPIINRTNKSPVHRRRLMAAGLFLAAPGMIELAVTPRHGMAIDLMGALLIGFGSEFVFMSGQMTVATDAPHGVRGRMMGLFFVLVTVTTAVGAVGLGLLINKTGIMTAFLATAVVAVVAGATLLVLGSRVPSRGE